MKSQEKLQHFYKVSLESAQEEAQNEIESYEKELEDGFASYKEDKLHQEETNRKTEQESARRQINKEISSEQIELRRRLSVCRDECKQQLFQEVEQKLKDYRKDPSYEEYLFGKYKKALAFAGDDTIELILSSGDAAFAKSLEKKLSHAITVSDEDFGGGIRAVIEARNIQIDDSFSSMMEAERQSYIYEGGVTHE